MTLVEKCNVVVRWQKDKNGKKTEKEYPVGCTGEGKRRKCNIGEGSKEGKTGIVLKLGLEVR